jgi:hypothetical protein
MSGMTIPTIPALPAGYVVQLADLQNLAAAATFALGKPMSSVIDNTGGQAITTSFAAVTFTTAVFDLDGMWAAGNPTRLTVQTPGWYKVRYGVNAGSVGGIYNTAVGATTGPNNPQGSGIASAKYWGGYSNTSSGKIGVAAASGDWPFFLYQGDYLSVFVEAAATGSSTGTSQPTGFGQGGSYFGLELVSI